MARDFSGSTNSYLYDSGANFSGWGAVTMAVWFNPDVSSGTQTLMCVTDDDVSDRYMWLYAGATTIAFTTRWGSSAQGTGGAGGTYSTGQWHHACAIRAGDTDRRVFLDGGGKATGSGDDGFSSASFPPDCVALGALRRTTVQDYLNGKLAWPCIWNVALTDAEVTTLAAGVHPFLVRPESIVWFAPLTGATSGNEVDIIGGRTLVKPGTVGTAESPLVSMGGVWPVNYTPAAAGATTGILRNLTRAIERGHSGVAAAQLGGVLA